MRVLSRISCGRNFFFFFNDTATTEIYTLSLHDALPISQSSRPVRPPAGARASVRASACSCSRRSEEHTSELQSPCNLVCRLLLEKKKTTHYTFKTYSSHTSILCHSSTSLMSILVHLVLE